MGRNKMVHKFKKIAAVIKAAAITKVSAETDNNYSKIYKQAIVSKNKHK